MEEEFGVRIKRYRKEHYLTQKQLAEMIGVSANHIGTLENGKKRPRASTIEAFEEAVRRQARLERNNGAGASLDADQRLVYAQICHELNRLDPEKRGRVMEMFFRILEWMLENMKFA